MLKAISIHPFFKSQFLHTLLFSLFISLSYSCSENLEQGSISIAQTNTLEEKTPDTQRSVTKPHSFTTPAPKLTIAIPDLQLTIISTNTTQANLAHKKAQATYLNTLNKWFSWRVPQGLLGQTNRALNYGYTMALSAADVNYLKHLKSLSLQSEGIFNPAIGNIQELWGFFRTPIDNLPISPPNTKRLNRALSLRSNMKDIHFTTDGLFSNNKHAQLELYTTIQGHLIEQIFQALLPEKSLQWANIKIGKTQKILNTNKNHIYPIKLPYKNPKNQAPSARTTLYLCHGDVITQLSKNSNSINYRDQNYHHIIDPKTARPAKTELQSVTILSTNAIQAQAAARAALIANQQWQQTINAMQTNHAFVIQNKQTQLSAALKAYLKIPQPTSPHCFISHQAKEKH